MAGQRVAERIDWVDVAKGICIILVVMMHSTLGVEKAAGSETAIHSFITWAQPFRMPDFFLISGLFLAARIDRPWRSYLDTKVVHFAYFYVLWLTIQFAMKAPGMAAESGLQATLQHYALSYVEPFGTLWFIYLLAIFFVATKLLHGVPKLTVFAAAAALHVLAPHTGWLAIDEFTDRFVFFYSGYAAASYVIAYAGRVSQMATLPVLAALAAWAVINWIAVEAGIALTKGPDLAFSYVGIAAVIAVSVVLARSGYAQALAYCGRNSIVIYLAFALFMAPTRVLLLKIGGGSLLGAAALTTTAVSVLGALVLYWIVRDTRLGFLFVRPPMFRLQPSRPQYAIPRRALVLKG